MKNFNKNDLTYKDLLLDKLNYHSKHNKNYQEVAYNLLCSLLESGSLEPGRLYRLINYVTTTTSENTSVGNHLFDIIVTADNASTLNENARALLHNGENYFVNCNLAAWELKYSLKNDRERFDWAKDHAIYVKDENAIYHWFTYKRKISIGGNNYYLWYDKDFLSNEGTDGYVITEDYSYSGSCNEVNLTAQSICLSEYKILDERESGKGVIYYMKDEWNNECPYDFKNIMFKRWKIIDASAPCASLGNTYYAYDTEIDLSEVGIYINIDQDDSTWCYAFPHINGSEYNNKVNAFTDDILMLLPNIVFNSSCYENNVKGIDITIGEECNMITGSYMFSIINDNCNMINFNLGIYLYLGIENLAISGNNYSGLISGNGCQFITLGEYAFYNIIGNKCISIEFDNYAMNNEVLKDKGQALSITFENGAYANKIVTELTLGESDNIQYIRISLGVSNKTISIPEKNLDYLTTYVTNNAKVRTI